MATVECLEPQATGLLGSCRTCSLPLPLRLAEAGEESQEWSCTGCGTTYQAVLLGDWPLEFRRNVSLEAAQEVETGAADPGILPADLEAEFEVDHGEPNAAPIPDRPAVLCELETALSRQFDAEINHGANLVVRPKGEPFIAGIRAHGEAGYEKGAMNRLLRTVHHSAEQLKKLFASLHSGISTELHLAESVSRGGLSGAAEDLDLFVYLGITPSSGGYPSRHSIHVAMLATSIGVTLGWDEQTLVDLGVGCLLHDVGMLRVSRGTYRGNRILDGADFAEIAKHPVFTIGLLERHLDRVSTAARMVAYQMHERCNGSGYPRGFERNRIHQLAEVAGVADVFVALVSPRPHRPPIVPHHALKKILHDTQNGLYSPDVVRALLETVSLFPIGSYVTMNDGRIGKVIRSTRQTYDRPIVEVWRRREPFGDRSVVDLSQQRKLRISGTLAGPTS